MGKDKVRKERRRRFDSPIGWVMQHMRAPLVIASVACSLLVQSGMAEAAAPMKKAGSARKQGLTIRVEGNDWGQANREAIETVLYSVADELLQRLPHKLTTPIVVTHTDSNPIALYDRGPAGEYLVQLHAKDKNWHLYVYEFAHELCHILSNYDENGGDPSRYNQWFEETLCETASLFTLKNLAMVWKTAPPVPEWSREADKLGRFFEILMSEAHRRLPPNTPLAAWLRVNERELRGDPYLRGKNEVVANLLLPLFERHPNSWDALTYLNLDPNDARNSLQEYLHDWYDNAPDQHKSFIANVLAMLRLGDVAPPTAPATPEAPGRPRGFMSVSTEGNAARPPPVPAPEVSSPENQAPPSDDVGRRKL